MSSFVEHHSAISVADLGRARAFYERFGFRLVLQWGSADGSLTIAHLRLPTGYLLEVFHYAKNASVAKAVLGAGNNLEDVGMKHLAFRVDNLAEVQAGLTGGGHECTAIQAGRTGIDYFFVRDPDGLWVEVVEDHRALDPARPIHLEG